MAKKQFKTESKKLLDMMINSIYTHKEVFLRELISNASDACDKLRFRSLTDDSIKIPIDGYEIRLEVDKAARTLTITDNGCGMTYDELEKNLGTIAKSGSYDFKANEAAAADTDEPSGEDRESDDAAAEKTVNVIGQFGVGFYSAFMVSDDITVVSRAYGDPAEEATIWKSKGIDGYTIEKTECEDTGTTITLHMKEDTETEKYSEFLEEWRIRELIKKYSDYIRYPIMMLVEKSRPIEEENADENAEPKYETYKEDETLNSMIPIWKRAGKDVTTEEYAEFYKNKFYDYEDPLKVIRLKSEGSCEFISLMFIPAAAPYNYYSREYEKGLQLYSSGVLIMDKCKDVLPDYFSFVRGLVDSDDLTLNISRETLQHDHQLKIIAKAVEKKIASELAKLQSSERENYEKFYKAFGTQLKYGVYSDYGMHQDLLKDLIMFASTYEAEETDGFKPAYVTFAEYAGRMKEDQKKIYYAAGENTEALKMLPQVEAVTGAGYEVLLLTEEIDEFAIKMMRGYKPEGKDEQVEFINVCQDDLDLETDAEKKGLEEENKKSEDMFKYMSEKLGEGLGGVRFSTSCGKHPACISSDGFISANMEKTMSRQPGGNNAPKAKYTLDINLKHPIAERLRTLYETDKETFDKYSKVIYAQARLTSGMSIDNPAELGDLVADILADK